MSLYDRICQDPKAYTSFRKALLSVSYVLAPANIYEQDW